MTQPGAPTRRDLLAGAAGIALAPGATRAAASCEDAHLDAFFEAAFQRDILRDPVRQSALGIKTSQDKWTDVGEGHRVEDATLKQADLRAAARFDPTGLSAVSRLSLRLFEYDTRQDLTMFRWRGDYYPLCQMHGLQRVIPQTLINNHPIADRDDAEAYVARLNGVEALLDQQIVELRRNAAAGSRPPAFVYPLVIGTCRNLTSGPPFEVGGEENPIFADFRAKLANAPLPQVDKERLTARAAAALTGHVGPGFRKLIAWLQEAQAATTHDAGVWSLPKGDAYYAAILQVETTLPIDPEAVHALGLSETARIQDEIRALTGRIGFTGSLQEFYRFVRADPQFYYPNTDQGRAAYVTASQALIDEMSGRLGEVIGHKPRSAMIIKPVEPWLQKSAGTAGYFAGAADGSRPGILYYNLRDMALLPKYEMSALAYHEGVPGHHVQNSIAIEMTGIPKFRSTSSYDAYDEGWGLYAEQIPRELGLYRDPYQDFGRLSMELLRAGRLVVDSGIHARRWTRAQAVAWLDANTPNSHDNNVTSVNRYCVSPAQACAYEMGKLKLLELRERARRALGAQFDLRGFHDAALGQGSVPLPVLEDIINAWIGVQTHA